MSVGGTTLTLGSSSQYAGETGWSSSGGGISTYESKPSYQSGVTLGGSARTNPDVAFDANPNTGVAVYSQAYGRGKSYKVGGTRPRRTAVGGMVGAADQARVLAGAAVFRSRPRTS